MTCRLLTFLAAAACWSLPASAMAGGIAFSQSFQGSITQTQTDVNGDGGATASVGQFAGSGTLGGGFTATSVSETESLPLAENINCAPGELEFPLVAFSIVQRISAASVLLYFVLDPVGGGYTCADPVLGTISGSVSLLIAGGTGPVAGATGVSSVDFTGQGLLADPLGNGVHTAFVGSATGTLILP